VKIDLYKTNGSSPPNQEETHPEINAPVSEHDDIWTVAEAASYLKMSHKQVLELTRRRSQERSDLPIPCFTIHSKCLRFRERDVQQWLASLAQKARVE
jgi:predicted DNA-binding transcriptional regulator AlpA